MVELNDGLRKLLRTAQDQDSKGAEFAADAADGTSGARAQAGAGGSGRGPRTAQDDELEMRRAFGLKNDGSRRNLGSLPSSSEQKSQAAVRKPPLLPPAGPPAGPGGPRKKRSASKEGVPTAGGPAAAGGSLGSLLPGGGSFPSAKPGALGLALPPANAGLDDDLLSLRSVTSRGSHLPSRDPSNLPSRDASKSRHVSSPSPVPSALPAAEAASVGTTADDEMAAIRAGYNDYGGGLSQAGSSKCRQGPLSAVSGSVPGSSSSNRTPYDYSVLVNNLLTSDLANVDVDGTLAQAASEARNRLDRRAAAVGMPPTGTGLPSTSFSTGGTPRSAVSGFTPRSDRPAGGSENAFTVGGGGDGFRPPSIEDRLRKQLAAAVESQDNIGTQGPAAAQADGATSTGADFPEASVGSGVGHRLGTAKDQGANPGVHFLGGNVPRKDDVPKKSDSSAGTAHWSARPVGEACWRRTLGFAADFSQYNWPEPKALGGDVVIGKPAVSGSKRSKLLDAASSSVGIDDSVDDREEALRSGAGQSGAPEEEDHEEDPVFLSTAKMRQQRRAKMKNVVVDGISDMRSACGASKPAFRQTAQLLAKVFRNLLLHPGDKKYCRIKLAGGRLQGLLRELDSAAAGPAASSSVLDYIYIPIGLIFPGRMP